MLRHLWVGIVLVAALSGQTFTTIANFGGAFTSPTELILGPDGNFYGVAQELSAPQPGGVIFRNDADGDGRQPEDGYAGRQRLRAGVRARWKYLWSLVLWR
jgi:hypothetical protein